MRRALFVSPLLVFCTVAAWQAAPVQPTDDLLAQLREIPTATLSDAVDEVVGQRGFMSHQIRPVSEEGRIAGRARTVQLVPRTQAAEEPAGSVQHTVEAIDESGPGDILVIVNGDPDIATFGGLMSTTSKVREIEGVVTDGAVRDVAQIRELRLPVYSRSISPATSVGRQFTLQRDVPVLCGDVVVQPGDYIVADLDGVVRIPAAHIRAVLERSLKMEEQEEKMIPAIMKLKSLGKAIEMFGRI